MKYSKKLVLTALLILMTSGSFLLFSNEIGKFYINKALDDHKVGSVLSGPYDSLEQAIAGWIATNQKEDSFYCISQGNRIVATKPSKQFPDTYNPIKQEFIDDYVAASSKYEVALKPAAKKKLDSEKAKMLKKMGIEPEKPAKEKKSKKSEAAPEDDAPVILDDAPIILEDAPVILGDETETAEEEAPAKLSKEEKKALADQKKAEEKARKEEEKAKKAEEKAAKKNKKAEPVEEEVSDEPEIIEEIPAGPTEEELQAKKLEEERIAAEKEALRLEEERKAKEKEQEELEKAQQEEAIRKALENVTKKNPVSRYHKEYLQDYMKDDPDELPDDYETAETPLIADPDQKDANGQTLLMKAAKSGNEWQLKLLIKSGADLNIKDNDGWTALMYAVRYQESVGAVTMLIDAKADIKAKNNYNSNALLIAACYNNNPEILNKILSYYSISEKDVLKAFTQLLSSTLMPEYVQLAKINIFFEKSIQLNTFYEGKTPLMYAAQYGNSTKVIKLLLDNGCITTVRSTEGKTAFEYASKNTKLKHDDYYWALNKK